MAKASLIGNYPGETAPGDPAPVETAPVDDIADKARRNQARHERLAAALKSNLRRRKTQARERAADAGGEAAHSATARTGAPDDPSAP